MKVAAKWRDHASKLAIRAHMLERERNVARQIERAAKLLAAEHGRDPVQADVVAAVEELHQQVASHARDIQEIGRGLRKTTTTDAVVVDYAAVERRILANIASKNV